MRVLMFVTLFGLSVDNHYLYSERLVFKRSLIMTNIQKDLFQHVDKLFNKR